MHCFHICSGGDGIAQGHGSVKSGSEGNYWIHQHSGGRCLPPASLTTSNQLVKRKQGAVRPLFRRRLWSRRISGKSRASGASGYPSTSTS